MTSTARNPLTFPKRAPNLSVSAATASRFGALRRAGPHRQTRSWSNECAGVQRQRGLSPTIAQARRLFHLADDECLEISRSCCRKRFLDLCADDPVSA